MNVSIPPSALAVTFVTPLDGSGEKPGEEVPQEQPLIDRFESRRGMGRWRPMSCQVFNSKTKQYFRLV